MLVCEDLPEPHLLWSLRRVLPARKCWHAKANALLPSSTAGRAAWSSTLKLATAASDQLAPLRPNTACNLARGTRQETGVHDQGAAAATALSEVTKALLVLTFRLSRDEA